MFDLELDIIASNEAAERNASGLRNGSENRRRGGVPGRRWELVRNDPMWLFSYAMRPDFTTSADWRAMFRIPFQMFQEIVNKIRPNVQRSLTSFRPPLPAEKRIAAFLMMASSCTYRRVANQLGMGPSSVHTAVRDVSRAICSEFASNLSLPTSTSEIASIMKGFQQIAGLPYCVGAIDGSHIPWKRCPSSQFYEYRCYKGFESVIIFALASADRRIIYADIGSPGVMSDSTLYERSNLRKMMDSGQWCGSDIPSLFIDGIEVRPYIMGDGAFTLSSQLMKTCSKAEMAKSQDLVGWETRASSTRKPVECAFGILKNRFSTLSTGVMLENEDDVVYLITACVILHNMCLSCGDSGDDFLVEENDQISVNSSATTEGKRVRDALLRFAIETRTYR